MSILSPAQEATWSETDTRLANHYIQLLQTDPEYGNVLDLLWKLYEKRSQTELLLQYFKTASTADEAPTVASLLYAHLLRKNEQLDEARTIYGNVLEAEPDNLAALLASAELADQQKRSAKALSLYNRLVELIPASDEEGVTIRLRRASLLKESDQLDEAVAVWKELLAAAPQNRKLRIEIVALLLEAGKPNEASSVLEELATADDPEQKLEALREINRLAEFVDDFDRAKDAAQRGMALLHFKNFQYDDFFGRLVRLHERFGRLDELESELTSVAAGDNPSEKNVYLMAQFYALTANEKKHLEWSQRLSESAPGNLDYRLRYILALIENDQFSVAVAALDKVIEENPEAGLPIVLLRTRLILNSEGVESAAQFLTDTMANPAGPIDRSPETLGKVLNFARENYLDTVVEQILSSPDANIATGGEVAAPLELAKFMAARGRRSEAKKELDQHVENAGESKTLRVTRLAEVASVFRELDMLPEAESAMTTAIELDPESLQLQIVKAEIQVERSNLDGALATYQSIWDRSPDIDSRTEMDQRLFSLLRGIVDEDDKQPNNPSNALTRPGGPIQTVQQYQKLARAANRIRAQGSNEPPSKKLTAFFEQIKKDANSQQTVATKYRAAWWAFKLQDFREMYHLLTDLHNPDQPIIEVEKLLLDLAEQTENDLLATRQLELLAKFDPDNEVSYRRRWAELRFQLGYEEEGIRTLEALASDPDASLETLKTLASVYAQQGRTNGQIKVWEEAYRRGNVFEKRQIIRQLTSALIEQGRPEDALKAQLGLIQAETDLVQKRKQFDSQLSVATRHYRLQWLEDRFTELAQQHPFDRFYPEALARIHRASGDIEAAFQAMKRAYYMSGQDIELLADLGELASQTDDLGAAIYYRRQLISQNEDEAGVDAWKPLIEMLESDLRIAEAERIRRRLEGKFANDADFLRDLSQRWAANGRFADASRVLEKIVGLRPWDSIAWFELGILRKRIGDTERALEAFEKTIERTRDVSIMEEGATRISRFPITEGGWFDGVGQRPSIGGLEGLATAIEEYRFFPRESTDSILDWLGQTHPEFHTVPKSDPELRLRAIEEAAKIYQSMPEASAEWIARWKDATPDERLWASVHSGDSKTTKQILATHFLPAQNARERVFLNLLYLRVGDVDSLVQWSADSDGVKLGTELNRKIFPPLAAFMLMRENAPIIRDDVGDEETPIRQANLEKLFREVPVSTTVGWHFTNEMRRSGLLRSALAVGEVLATENQKLSGEGDFLFSLSQISNWLGLPEKRQMWLDRAIEAMEPNLFRGLPATYHSALADKLSLLQDEETRNAFVAAQQKKIDQHPRAKELAKIENHALLAMANKDGASALEAIRAMAKRQLLDGLPDTGMAIATPDDSGNFASSSNDDYSDSQQWQRMERLLNAYAPRLPAGTSLPEFYRVVAGEPAVTPDFGENSEASRNSYEQFTSGRLMWLLEPLTPPERASAVRSFAASLQGDPSSLLELSRTLEVRGFHREAISIYLEIIAQNPDDLVPVRNLFAASRQANSYSEALDLLNGYLSGDRAAPSGMTESDLVQNHAELLVMARDTSTLADFANGTRTSATNGPPTSPGAPARRVSMLSGDRNLTNYYRRGQLRAHRLAGENDAVLSILKHDHEVTNSRREDDAVLAARILLEKGDHENAIVWLDRVSFDQDDVPAEKNALRLLSEVYSEPEYSDTKALARFGRAAQKYDDTNLIQDISKHLHRGGASTSANGLLQLRASHKGVSLRDRVALFSQMIHQSLESGITVTELAPDISAMVEMLPPDPVALRDFFSAIGIKDSSSSKEWEQVLKPFASRIESSPAKISAAVAIAGLNGDLDSLEQMIDIASSTDQQLSTWLFGIQELATLEIPGAAALGRQLLDQIGLRWTQLFSRDPAQQIQFFAAVSADEQAQQLYQRLLGEADSDVFLQRSNTASIRLAGGQAFSATRGSWTGGDDVPTFSTRMGVPTAFSKAGYHDLATSLFQRFRGRLLRITWEHTGFMEGYIRHLIETGQTNTARKEIAVLLHKSLGVDPQLYIDFLESSEQLANRDEFEKALAALYPTDGLRLRIIELRETTLREKNQ